MTTDNDSMPDGFDQKSGPAAFADTADKAAASPENDNITVINSDAMVTALQAELAQYKDQMLRALADAENTRRRAERDREDAGKYAITNFARALLTVADNLRRALEAAGPDLQNSDPRVAALLAGVEATERDLLNTFDRTGIKKIVAMDQQFNANFHDVMFEAPGTGKPAGTIIQVVEEGYTIHDRLLRPARVGVAKADPGTPPAAHALDEQV